MDQVCNGNDPVMITRKSKASVVMMSLEEYQAMEETIYLLRSRANAINLLESIAELEESKSTE
jgi:antitoxin YefM